MIDLRIRLVRGCQALSDCYLIQVLENNVDNCVVVLIKVKNACLCRIHEKRGCCFEMSFLV